MAESGIRLTDLLVALSLVTDIGFGQPSEHMIRSTQIGMRIGNRLGLDSTELATLFDVGLLTYVGCSIFGNETAAIFGDDIDFRSQAIFTDLVGLDGMRFLLRHAGSGKPLTSRALQKLTLLSSRGRQVTAQMANHCAAAGMLATRLGLDDNVRFGVEQAYARWDGKGVPDTLYGDKMSLSARIAQVAELCEVHERTNGIDSVVAAVSSRSGGQFDPAIVAAVTSDAPALFDKLDELSIEAFVDSSPSHFEVLADDALDQALEAVGDFGDMRCPFFAGHAHATAELGKDAAIALQLPDADVRLTYRAALVHDIGRFGVPAAIWSKKTTLSRHEQERARLHSYYIERIFARPEPLRQIGMLAATHHERMDGAGYHRGIGPAMLNRAARVLSAADAYCAMRQTRPYRGALNADEAARSLRSDVDNGLFDGEAVDAVLTAAGHRQRRTSTAHHSILTAREAEVLELVARGMSNKDIARALGITAKTVGNHVEHIYSKIDVTNRAGAAMYAMQHGFATCMPSNDR